MRSSNAKPTFSTDAGQRLQLFALYGFGVLFTVSVAFLGTTGHVQFWELPSWRTLTLATVAACALCLFVVRSLTMRPEFKLHRSYRLAAWFLSTAGSFAALVVLLDLFGIERPQGFALVTFAAFLPVARAAQSLQAPDVGTRIGFVPVGRLSEVLRLRAPQWRDLSRWPAAAVDAVAVDFHARLTPDWKDFVADCQLSNIPVLHAATLYEQMTGRVSLRYMRERVLTDLQPRPAYAAFKRYSEVALIVALLPVLVPLMLLTALAIRLESRGSVLFWQDRVGMHGNTFRMVKFRSMRFEAEQGGARFASGLDARVTRVGRVIRKMRLDELPQIYNVLRGDMALIGPRPEQAPFVREFEATIPFYGYRHLVRPGLTGWAQVKDGYAAGAAETEEKLTYDLFYVKNLSPWLDALIVLLTIRTILTGFGAR